MEATENKQALPIVRPATILAKYLADNRDKIERSLDGSLPADKFLQVSMNSIRGNEKLESSTPSSVLSCLLQAAEVRLFPGSTLGHAYLVPYWNNKTRAFICTYILGYKGMLALCHRSPKVLKVEAQTVHEGDEFEVSYGAGGGLKHKPDPWAERTVENCIGAYAVAELSNGTQVFERMSKAELEKLRLRSKSGKHGPWTTDRLAMYRKSVVRKLATWLPLEPCDQVAVAEDEARDLGYSSTPREVDSEDVVQTKDILNAAMETKDGGKEPEGGKLDEAGEPVSPPMTEEQGMQVSEWLASDEVDTPKAMTVLGKLCGSESLTGVSTENAKEFLRMCEGGDFSFSEG